MPLHCYLFLYIKKKIRRGKLIWNFEEYMLQEETAAYLLFD